jgi:O-6-methylguanine DNA methyltransferase
MRLFRTATNCPLGPLVILASAKGIMMVEFADHAERYLAVLRRRFGEVEIADGEDAHGAVPALDAYFKGRLDAIDGLPVDAPGTEFQRSVWAELRRIPVGRTISYRDLAHRIGRPTATRAVGAANGQNPVGIVVPCHRVIGASGTLTGYSGGIERKRWLLAHEGALTADLV